MRRRRDKGWLFWLLLTVVVSCLLALFRGDAHAAETKVFGSGGFSLVCEDGEVPVYNGTTQQWECGAGGGGGGGTPGGSDGQAQYRVNASEFGGFPLLWNGTVMTFPGARVRIDANGDLEILDSNWRLYSGSTFPVTLGGATHQSTLNFRGGNTLSIAGITVASLFRGNTTHQPGGVQGIQSPAATVRGLIIQGAASQSANLLEFRDNSNNFLTGFDALGNFGGQAATAAALASDPSGCPAGDFVEDIDADGTLICDTPAAGGGASEIADLTDLKVTRNADTGILDIAAGRARYGNTLYTISAATVELDDASSTGDAEVFVGQDGTLTVAHTPGMTVVCTGCTAGGGGAGIPQTAIPLARWSSSVSGVWEASGTERRSLSNGIVPVNGAGLSASDTGGIRTLAVDPSSLTAQADPDDADLLLFQRDSDGLLRKINFGELKTEIGAAGAGTPAGSGTEIQYRLDASNFGALPGSSVAANFVELLEGDTNPAVSLVKNSSITGDIQTGVNGGGWAWLSTATAHPLRFGLNFNWRLNLPASGGAVEFWDPADQTKILRFDPSNLPTATTRGLQAPTADGVLLTDAMQHAGTDIEADLEEESHATEHQHGGGDEVATATPGANAIPKAGAGNTLADGWIAESSVTQHQAALAVGAPQVGNGDVDDAELSHLDGVTSAIQTQLDGKLTSASTITDTESFGIGGPVTGHSDIPQLKKPWGWTITEVCASTDTGTVTFQIDERAATTPNTSGTNVMSSSLVADSDEECASGGTITNGGIASGAIANWTISDVSGAAKVRFHVTYSRPLQ